MEVSFVNKPSADIKKPPLVSKSNHSPIPSRLAELVVADDEQDKNKCKHFTIRGYVAEVRKRDTNICWPFHMLHNHSSDKHANSLPPLSVTNFRWWGCPNCLNKTIVPEAVIANEAVMNIQNGKAKTDNNLLLVNATVASHPNSAKSVSTSPQLSEENILEGRLLEEDCSINVNNGVRHQSLCCYKEENEPVIKGLVKEGSRISIVGQDMSEEEQNHLSKSIVVATEGEACLTRERGERNIGVRVNTSGIALIGEKTPNNVFLKQMKSERIHGVDGAEMSDELMTSTRSNTSASVLRNDQGLSRTGKMKESEKCVSKEYGLIPLGVVRIPEVDALIANSAHMYNIDSVCLDKGNHKASDSNICLTTNIVQKPDDAPQPAVSVENCHHRKARKVRLLDDIIKSEELRKTETVYNLSGDTKNSAEDNGRRPDESNDRAQCLGHKTHQSTEVKPTKLKNRNEAVTNDDEGPSLMHWLKNMPNQKISCKGDAKAQNINTAAIASKIVVKSSAGKLPDLNVEVCGEKGHKKEILVDKEHNQIRAKSPRPSVNQHDSLTGKGHKIPSDLGRKRSHSEAIDSKSTGVLLTEKSLHHGREIHSHKMSLLSRKESKQPRTEVRESSHIHWLEDSFGIQKQAGYQVQENVTKKQRTTRTCEKESLDDIPMDIVELLATKQHERRLMNGEVATENVQDSLEMTEGMKDCNSWDITGFHGNKVSNVVHGNLAEQNSQSIIKADEAVGYPVQIVSGSRESNRNSNYNAYHSSTGCKQKRNIDLNQQAPISTFTDSQPFSQYIGLAMNGSQLSVIEPNRECRQNFCQNGMIMTSSGSLHMDQITSGQNSCRNAYGHSSVPLDDTPSGTNARKVVDLSHFNRDCNTSSLEGSLKTVAYNKAGYGKPINSHDKCFLNSIDKAASSNTGGTPAATSSYVEVGNGYAANLMGPVDLCTNDTVSALNLLRLMDRAAYSSEPCHSSTSSDHIGSTQESDLYCSYHGNELLRSEVGMRSREAPKHHLTVGNPDRDQQLGNSCKPLRPLPRVGVLGPSLQKEIANNLNYSRTPFGFGAKHSLEQTSIMTNGKEKGEASHFFTCANVLNAGRSISRDQNSKWIAFDVGSHSHPTYSLTRDNIGQIGYRTKDGAVQPLRSNCKVDVCVLNRNPADFTVLDEDNEYMIGNEEPRPIFMPNAGSAHHPSHLDGQKRQKLMKLDDL